MMKRERSPNILASVEYSYDLMKTSLITTMDLAKRMETHSFNSVQGYDTETGNTQDLVNEECEAVQALDYSNICAAQVEGLKGQFRMLCEKLQLLQGEVNDRIMHFQPETLSLHLTEKRLREEKEEMNRDESELFDERPQLTQNSRSPLPEDPTFGAVHIVKLC